MDRVIFLVYVFVLLRFAYTAKFYKLFTVETGLNDIGPALIFSTHSASTIECATKCLSKAGCLAVVYHNGSQVCNFLNSTGTLTETSDVGYSYIFIGDHCMKDWKEFGASCYLFGPQTYTWSGAIDFCKTRDAKLVEIENVFENVFIQDTLETVVGTKHWIGMTDVDVEGVWVWASGPIASYTDWGSNQPNNGLVSNCGAIWESFEYKWVDEPCTNLYYPICEQPSTSVP